MEEVFSLKGDCHAWYGDIIIMVRAVVDICANSKCNWFGLAGGRKTGGEMKISDSAEDLNDSKKNKKTKLYSFRTRGET